MPPEASTVTISIVIPVINEAAIVASAVDWAWRSDANEVVVVDGGSTDGTAKILKGLECVLVESSPGRGQQLNAGAKVSTSDVLLFLHADNWLCEGGCQQIRKAVQDGVRAGCFRQKIQNDKLVFRWIESGNAWRVKMQSLIYGDQALFLVRDLFDEIGGFPNIVIMEDFEFSRSLGRLTKPVVLDGPTFVAARRWEKNGAIRQTVTNWFLSTAYRLGATPEWIASNYRRHDNDY